MSSESQSLHPPIENLMAAHPAGMGDSLDDMVGKDSAAPLVGTNRAPVPDRLGRLNGSARERAFAGLQRAGGNAYVQRLVRQAAPVQVQRIPKPEDEPAPDLSGLGMGQQKLSGHGQTGGGAPAPTGPTATTPPSAGVVTANINLTVHAPSIVRKTAHEIASSHGRAGSAGWTTPAYSIADPGVAGNSLTINVTLDFIIELDSEREGEALAVISDHEQGHVHIGEAKARQHLVTGFKSALEAMPRLSRSGYSSAQNTAITNFTTEEGTDSAAYDAVDYPRMMLANTGAKTPLSTLARRFHDIAASASSLRAYAQAFRMATYSFNYIVIDDATVIARADAVIAATDALSPDSLSLLQYNPQFKALVSNVRLFNNQYTQQQRNGPDFMNQLPSDANISAPVREKLQILEAALGVFSWSAPV